MCSRATGRVRRTRRARGGPTHTNPNFNPNPNPNPNPNFNPNPDPNPNPTPNQVGLLRGKAAAAALLGATREAAGVDGDGCLSGRLRAARRGAAQEPVGLRLRGDTQG